MHKLGRVLKKLAGTVCNRPCQFFIHQKLPDLPEEVARKLSIEQSKPLVRWIANNRSRHS